MEEDTLNLQITADISSKCLPNGKPRAKTDVKGVLWITNARKKLQRAHSYDCSTFLNHTVLCVHFTITGQKLTFSSLFTGPRDSLYIRLHQVVESLVTSTFNSSNLKLICKSTSNSQHGFFTWTSILVNFGSLGSIYWRTSSWNG